MQEPRAVSFDLDGTLASVRLRRLRLWRGALRHHHVLTGYPAAVEGMRGRRLADLDGAIALQLATDSGRTPTEVRRVLADWIDTRWPHTFDDAVPPPAVARLIERCDRLGIPRAVVSDHPALDKLSAMGLGGWAAVVSCRRLGALKPLPDGLHAAAAQLGVPVRSMVHVGDRADTDGAMAAAAGAAFVDVAVLNRRGLPTWACP